MEPRKASDPNRVMPRFGKGTEVVLLEPGRWTTQRPDEKPSEAMKRLEAGGPDVYEGSPPERSD